jgi:hypothetical protein
MASRKEEKERLRQQRLAAERRDTEAARRRLLLGYVVAGLLAAAVVVGIVVVIASGGGNGDDEPSGGNAAIDPNSGIVPDDLSLDEREGTEPPAVQQADLEEAARAAGCELKLGLPDEGAGHLAPNEKAPDYGTSPATSGDHDPNPLADGAYLDTPEPRNVVHSLEHGRIEIQYQPDLPEEDQLLLKGLFDEDPQGMLLFPNPDMPYEVAATAWTNLIGCERFSEETVDAVRDFRDEFRAQGPEPVPL